MKKIIMIMLLMAMATFAGRKEYKEDVLSYRNEFKEYNSSGTYKDQVTKK